MFFEQGYFFKLFFISSNCEADVPTDGGSSSKTKTVVTTAAGGSLLLLIRAITIII